VAGDRFRMAPLVFVEVGLEPPDFGPSSFDLGECRLPVDLKPVGTLAVPGRLGLERFDLGMTETQFRPGNLELLAEFLELRGFRRR
jgi:hypothetical protein